MVFFRSTSATNTWGCSMSLLLLLLQNAVVVDATSNCTLSNPMDLSAGLTLQQAANYDDGTFTMKITYTGGNSWLGIGINKAGKSAMFPGTAVIGRVETDGTTSVGHYELSSDSSDASGVNLISADSSLFKASSFVQPDSSTSELTFTFPLETMGVQSDSVWIYAVGIPTNIWAQEHRTVGAFHLGLDSCSGSPATADSNGSSSSNNNNAVETSSGTKLINSVQFILMGAAWAAFA